MGETFVLIHGTWHGGWAWDAVTRELSGKGHRAHAPTLAGHGPGVARLGITHQDCVASVVAYIDHRRLEDVILVGHSFGGTVVQKVVEQQPVRLCPRLQGHGNAFGCHGPRRSLAPVEATDVSKEGDAPDNFYLDIFGRRWYHLLLMLYRSSVTVC